MASSAPEQPPEVTWAQRSSSTEATRNIIYLTINAPDVNPDSLKLDLQPTSVSFAGFSTSKKLQYKIKLDFFKEVDVPESKTHASPRGIEFILRKKELETEYWPRLTKEKAKLHFLKTDFDKWVDEDEQDEKSEEDPYAGYMGNEGMGGIDFSKLQGGGGLPDMGDLGAGMGGLGGMGGMPGMGGMEGGDDSDEEDLPELEDEESKKSADDVGSKKIEEVS